MLWLLMGVDCEGRESNRCTSMTDVTKNGMNDDYHDDIIMTVKMTVMTPPMKRGMMRAMVRMAMFRTIRRTMYEANLITTLAGSYFISAAGL